MDVFGVEETRVMTVCVGVEPVLDVEDSVAAKHDKY
jgi:hypothetical protein